MNSNRFILGLTGGIGTGKSTAAAFFKDRGFIHIDADKIGWELSSEGSPLLKELDAIFGPEGKYGFKNHPVLDEKGKLLRRELASVVFHDARRTEVFDRIMFSRIRRIIESRISETNEDSKILIDAPLLFESGADELCDCVILIVADMKKRVQRVCLRDGMSENEVKERIKSQLPDEEKKVLADYVLDNSGTLEELYDGLNRILSQLLP